MVMIMGYLGLNPFEIFYDRSKYGQHDTLTAQLIIYVSNNMFCAIITL